MTLLLKQKKLLYKKKSELILEMIKFYENEPKVKDISIIFERKLKEAKFFSEINIINLEIMKIEIEEVSQWNPEQI